MATHAISPALIALIMIGVTAAAIAGTSGLYLVFRRRHIGRAIACLFLSALLAGVMGVLFAVHFAIRVERWAGSRLLDKQAPVPSTPIPLSPHDRAVAEHRRVLESYVPAALAASVPNDFYTYDGFRDWWRIPLRFPYELQSIDSLDFASINKFNGRGHVDDPNISDTELQIWGITNLAFDGHYLLLQRVSKPLENNHGAVIWTLFNFDNERSEDFASRDSLIKAAFAAGYHGPSKMKTVKEWYDSSF